MEYAFTPNHQVLTPNGWVAISDLFAFAKEAAVITVSSEELATRKVNIPTQS